MDVFGVLVSWTSWLELWPKQVGEWTTDFNWSWKNEKGIRARVVEFIIQILPSRSSWNLSSHPPRKLANRSHHPRRQSRVLSPMDHLKSLEGWERKSIVPSGTCQLQLRPWLSSSWRWEYSESETPGLGSMNLKIKNAVNFTACKTDPTSCRYVCLAHGNVQHSSFLFQLRFVCVAPQIPK